MAAWSRSQHAGGFTTRYGHLSKILVKEGQELSVGDVVGKVGSSGRSTGPHLHYEVRRNGDALNPVRFLKAGQKVSQYLADAALAPRYRRRRPVGAAVDGSDKACTCFPVVRMHEIGITRGGVAEVDGEAVSVTAREGLGADIGAEAHLAHAVDDITERIELGMDRLALRLADVGTEGIENAMSDHRLKPFTRRFCSGKTPPAAAARVRG